MRLCKLLQVCRNLSAVSWHQGPMEMEALSTWHETFGSSIHWSGPPNEWKFPELQYGADLMLAWIDPFGLTLSTLQSPTPIHAISWAKAHGGTLAFWDLQISQQSWGPATDLGEENKKRTLQHQKVSKLVNEHNELSRICLKTLSLESQLCKQRDRTKRESNENKINQIWNKHGGTNMERKVRTWIQF